MGPVCIWAADNYFGGADSDGADERGRLETGSGSFI